MPHPYRKALYIFRRDLRLDDNSALLAALRQAKSVITVFIADEQLLKPAREFAQQFLARALTDLQDDLCQQGGGLCVLAGDVSATVENLIKKENLDAVFINRDYTPYARNRDNQLKRLCEKHAIGFHAYADQLLLEPEQAMKKDGTPYTVFTPFYRNAAQFQIAKPQLFSTSALAKPEYVQGLSVMDAISVECDNRQLANPEKLLARIDQFSRYGDERNFPALDKTTRLSAHLKWGTCSVRHVYHTVKNVHGSSHPLIRELFWRDFFTHIAWHFPYVFQQPFRRQYQKLRWSSSVENFSAWCQGRTGFPVVDAGMRELNATGFMHNRVRMITASFLIKHLHIDWRQGERYFSTKLTDYDPCVNNGNWQWAASTGCDAQPWFRIFNPWLQQKKFDPDCVYIRRWIPELRELDITDIHSPQRTAVHNYPAPMVDHATAVAITKQLYSAV